MGQFRIRDLMISVLPEGGLERFPICRGVTLPDCDEASIDLSKVGCNVSLCPNISRCMHVTLVADTCPAASYCTCGDITNFSKGCKGGGTTCAMPPEHTQLEELAILKLQLHQALGDVEARERALERKLRPETLNEVQDLEARLAAALEELATRRANLERSEPEERA